MIHQNHEHFSKLFVVKKSSIYENQLNLQNLQFGKLGLEYCKYYKVPHQQFIVKKKPQQITYNHFFFYGHLNFKSRSNLIFKQTLTNFYFYLIQNYSLDLKCI